MFIFASFAWIISPVATDLGLCCCRWLIATPILFGFGSTWLWYFRWSLRQ